MNAEEAAAALYPPEDGPHPGVDRNEQARFAFLRGVEWQTGALLASAEQIDSQSDPEPTKEQILDRYANIFCDGGAYRDVRINVDELWDDAIAHAMALVKPVIHDAAGRSTVRQDLIEAATKEVRARQAHTVTEKTLMGAIDRAIEETAPPLAHCGQPAPHWPHGFPSSEDPGGLLRYCDGQAHD